MSERRSKTSREFVTSFSLLIFKMKKQNKEFNLKEAREGLRYILMDKTGAGFGLDEEITKSILHLVRTSDKEFIKRLKKEFAFISVNLREDKTINEIIDKLAGEKLKWKKHQKKLRRELKKFI